MFWFWLKIKLQIVVLDYFLWLYIVFWKPIASHTELSRVARLVKPARAVGDEDSRYEIARSQASIYWLVLFISTFETL